MKNISLRLIRFINDQRCYCLPKESNQLPGSVRAGFLRGLLGAMYLTIYLLGSAYVSDDYILSSEFTDASLWKRFVLLGLWGRIALYKYICCWLLAEGACIVSGRCYLFLKEIKRFKPRPRSTLRAANGGIS